MIQILGAISMIAGGILAAHLLTRPPAPPPIPEVRPPIPKVKPLTECERWDMVLTDIEEVMLVCDLVALRYEDRAWQWLGDDSLRLHCLSRASLRDYCAQTMDEIMYPSLGGEHYITTEKKKKKDNEP